MSDQQTAEDGGPGLNLARIHQVAIRLHKDIQRVQWKQRNPFLTRLDEVLLHKRTSGLYPSYTQLSHFFLLRFVERPLLRSVSRVFRLHDSNMFATAIITLCLLEVQALGLADVDPEQVAGAVSAILRHRDHNLAAGTPGYCFYAQKRVDGAWVQLPDNIARCLNYLKPWPPRIYRLVRFLGADVDGLLAPVSPGVVDFVTKGNVGQLLGRFNMPCDADDTGLALALGSEVKASAGRHASAAQMWEGENHNLDRIMAEMVKYAYRPFSHDRTVNIIDPRTYYWMRRYLHKNRGQDLALLTTWMQHPYEGKEFGNRDTKIPMNMNNIEPTVAANMLLGINKALLAFPEQAEKGFDADFRQIYRDTVGLLCCVIEDDVLSDLPHITLLYYPAATQFYWSLARNLHFLENASRTSSLPYAEMEQARGWLSCSLRQAGTEQLLCRARGNDGDDGVFWRGVFENGSDRVYSRSVAINALLDIWTVKAQPEAGLVWMPNTPSEVKAVVRKGVRWLVQAITVRGLSLYNACFSGSIRGYATLPFHFPTNVHETHGDVMIFGVRGLMGESQYEDRLAQSKARLKKGILGEGSQHFSYWVSPVVTQATVLLALAKFLCLGPRPDRDAVEAPDGDLGA